jgi:hypothetical protein
MTRPFSLGILATCIIGAGIYVGSQPEVAGVCAVLAVVIAALWRAPSGDRLSPLRGQAPAGLASSSINPSRGENA